MREALKVAGIAASGLVVYFVLLFLSAQIPVLPTAHHSDWFAFAQSPSAGRKNMDIVYAAVHWYDGPVVCAISAAIVGAVSGLLRLRRSTLIIGTIMWLGVTIVAGGVPDVADGFTLLLGVLGCLGGAAMITPMARPEVLAATPQS